MDFELIEKQLAKVPREVKRAFFSDETGREIQAIGEHYGLMLDQIQDVIEETGLAMIGVKPAKQFVKNIAKRLNVTEEAANKIATDINNEVLAKVKERARQAEEKNRTAPEIPDDSTMEIDTASTDNTPSSAISTLEHAGGFDIEKAPEERDALVTPEDKSKILSSLENPQKSPERPLSRASAEEVHVDPMIDHLLAKPAAMAQQKTVQQPTAPIAPKPAAPAPKPVQQPKPGPDAYREPIS